MMNTDGLFDYMVRIRVGNNPFRILADTFRAATLAEARKIVFEKVLKPEVFQSSGRKTIVIRIFPASHLHSIDHHTDDVLHQGDISYSPNETFDVAGVRIPRWDRTGMVVTDQQMSEVAKAISNDPRLAKLVRELTEEYLKIRVEV